MAGTGDDPAALRAELVTMLPALRDVINWRQNHCGPLENEVQGLFGQRKDGPDGRRHHPAVGRQ